MSDTPHSRERNEVQKAILDLFATLTGLPITFYAETGSDLVSIESSVSQLNYQKHCTRIQTFKGGKEACDADQCSRAHLAIKTKAGGLSLCHAGMYNETVPIVVKGEVRGALLYGEMQIATKQNREKALEQHRQAVRKLGLSADQASELQNLLTNARTYEPKQLEAFKSVVAKVERWFYTLIDQEDHATIAIERVTHEIQTRLQAVIGNAENLANYAKTLSPEETAERARQVLSSAVALNTVIQTLGEYLGEYRFRLHPVSQVLWEARRIYKCEAANRGIDIRFEPPATERKVEISLDHFQHAINNLVHNAVKYSFRGGPDRDRYVRIGLQTGSDGYYISISNYGVGILPDEIASRAIFQKDYQGRLTQGEYRTGSGKGLFFADSVIKRHHGRIEVTSEHRSDELSPEGKPHHNRFFVFVPYRQPLE